MPFAILDQEVLIQEVPGPLVKMTLSGELDSATAPTFMAALEQISQHKPKQLVLFVSQLDFISSTGIRCLIFSMQKNRGIDVYLIAPQGHLVDSLGRVGLLKSVIIQEVYQPQN